MAKGLQRIMVTAIIKRKNKYLLVQRSKNNKTYVGYWQFPEGGIEYGETPLDALAREIKEETNLSLINAKLLWVYSSTLYPLKIGLHIIRIFYSCKVSGKITLSKECEKYGWFNKKEITNLKLIPGLNWEELKEII
ncbi:MAG: NUDIX hydrolase [Candidatus Aenigmatarchaeota archaeon]